MLIIAIKGSEGAIIAHIDDPLCDMHQEQTTTKNYTGPGPGSREWRHILELLQAAGIPPNLPRYEACQVVWRPAFPLQSAATA